MRRFFLSLLVLAFSLPALTQTKHPFTFYLAAMAIYLCVTGLSNPVFGWLERRAARGMTR